MDEVELTWMADGACRNYPAAAFFPSDGVGVDAARRICAECKVPDDKQGTGKTGGDGGPSDDGKSGDGSKGDGKQGGDPAKLADALVQLATLEQPPVRFAAGADAVAAFEQKAHQLLAQADAHRELSTSLAHDDA